jgi:3-hydroxybutyryl-CoA dehydratase
MEFAVRMGATLPEFVRQVTQVDISRYAEASGDYNPIHIDPAFAATTPLKGTIAHGMLVLAFMSEMLARVFGDAWDESGQLSMKFRSPARPGDTLSVGGTVESVQDDSDIVLATCSLWCRNQSDEVVVSGEARVRIPASV